MPATITQALNDALNLSSTTLANAVKVTRADGTIIGYTTHDADATIGGVLYKAAPGINSTQEAQSNDMAVDNLEIQGVFTSGYIRKIDVAAGLYDFAQFEKFIYDYTNPTGGTLTRVSGHLGEFKTRSDGVFTAQLLSSNDVVSQSPLELTAPMCRVKVFGDFRCKKNLAGNDVFGDPITVTGSITGILDSVVTRTNVTFQNMSGGGSGGTNMFLRSLAGVGFGSCGATSTTTATVGDCSAEWLLAAGTLGSITGAQGAAGFATSSTVTNKTGINFGVIWSVSGTGSALQIILNGVAYNKIGTARLNDRIRVSIRAGQMLVYQNDIQVFAVASTPTVTYPLYFGVALGTSGTQITQAVITTSTGGGLQLVDSTRTETYRTFPATSGITYTWRVFANGKITFTSGLNNGLSYQIKDWDSTLKAFTLMRPPGYPISVGDTYSAIKGCPRLLAICSGLFANAINARMEHALIGPERNVSRP